MSSSTTSDPPRNTNNNNNNGDSGSFFSPGSSPPLILAFLAIGLFSAAMVAVFGWRRVHFGRATTGFYLDPLGRPVEHSGRRQAAQLGDPPKLWDFWTDTPRDGVSTRNRQRDLDLGLRVDEWHGQEKTGAKFGPEDMKWDNVQPIAVTSLPKDDNDPDDPAANDIHTSNTQNSLPLTSPFHQRLRHLQRHYRNRVFRNRNMTSHDHRNTSDPQSQSDPEKCSNTSLSPHTSTDFPGTSGPVPMQIAVAIAMPTPPKKGKRMSVDSTFNDDEDRMEYALGFCRVLCECKEGREMHRVVA